MNLIQFFSAFDFRMFIGFNLHSCQDLNYSHIYLCRLYYACVCTYAYIKRTSKMHEKNGTNDYFGARILKFMCSFSLYTFVMNFLSTAHLYTFFPSRCTFMCVCAYMCIHINTLTHIHVCICLYIHTHININHWWLRAILWSPLAFVCACMCGGVSPTHYYHWRYVGLSMTQICYAIYLSHYIVFAPFASFGTITNSPSVQILDPCPHVQISTPWFPI